ncbi:MAG: hypothetical protein KatS3mg087_0492 [Patescibacteria group bacterium]|nr:MAG: hypothetical protein KatS3mg087_0492 [Patescibacteria group bacterium]
MFTCGWVVPPTLHKNRGSKMMAISFFIDLLINGMRVRYYYDGLQLWRTLLGFQVPVSFSTLWQEINDFKPVLATIQTNNGNIVIEFNQGKPDGLLTINPKMPPIQKTDRDVWRLLLQFIETQAFFEEVNYVDDRTSIEDDPEAVIEVY